MVFYSAIHSPSALGFRRAAGEDSETKSMEKDVLGHFSTKHLSRELPPAQSAEGKEEGAGVDEQESNEEEEACVDILKLPPIVIKAFLQLHRKVSNRHGKLRNVRSQSPSRTSNAGVVTDQLLISEPCNGFRNRVTTAHTTASTDVVVAGPNTAPGLATARFGNREAKTKQEHYAEVHTQIVKATQQPEIGLFTHKLVHECGLAGHAAVGHAAVPEVRRDTLAHPIGMERSVFVQQLTGVYGYDDVLPPCLMNSRAQNNKDNMTKQLAEDLSSADTAAASAAARSTAREQNSGWVQSEPTAFPVLTEADDLFSSFLVYQRNPNPFGLHTPSPDKDSGNISVFVHAWGCACPRACDGMPHEISCDWF